MEDQKKNDTNQSDSKAKVTEPVIHLMDKEPVAAEIEGSPAPVAAAVAPTKKNRLYTIIATALVVVALGAVWMRLEKEDRVSTSFFDSYLQEQSDSEIVAIVNGEELRNKELELSIEQQSQLAASQGVNPADPAVALDIRTQAVEMLVNTTLLRQVADESGVAATDEAVAERITELEEASGGAEVLAERMAEFDVDQATFKKDVRTELTILALLDSVFAEADISATDEEVAEIYNNAVSSGAEVPPLEEVRAEIEEQIVLSKEQIVVDEYLAELRTTADIEIVE